MNEYKKLINYLNSIINDIDTKKHLIEEKNAEQSLIKDSIEKVIEIIDNNKLNELNIERLGLLLNGLISESEMIEIIKKLTELLSMQSFLFDERVSNPIKQMMLIDLESIKSKLISISNGITPLVVAEEDIKLQAECKKYLEIVSETGYCKVLTDEERIAFYEFLKSTNLEDTLLLISNYIVYANKSKKQLKINTSSTAIEIIEKNAEEVVKELEENIKNEKTEQLEITAPPKLQVKDIELKEAYDKIIELLNIHQNDINPTTYDIYIKYFEELDIYEIYSKRSLFSTVDGIKWEIAIPCIKEKLLPNINSDCQLLIFRIFNEIIALNQSQLERYHQEKQKEETYKNELELFKKDFAEVVKKAEELKVLISNIINKINEHTRNNKKSIISLLEMVKKNDEYDDNVKEILNYYGITYDELKIYMSNDKIQENLNDIKEYIELEKLSEDDFKEIYALLEDTKKKIKDCEQYYQTIKERKVDNQEIKNEQSTAGKKQYEYGESVIVFFRKDECSRFLVEEDIDKQILDEKSYCDIQQILKRASETTHEKWAFATNDKSNFKSFIKQNKQNGDKGDTVTIKSDYSGIDYSFFRLKNNGKTNPRLTAFDIKMCEENRRKLGIPKNKHIILIIGEKQVTKFSKESQEYADIRRELSNNIELIKQYIELFENPNTSEDLLYKILNDSSDLYDSFKEKAKGLGD